MSSVKNLYPKKIEINAEDFYVPSNDPHCLVNHPSIFDKFQTKANKRGYSAKQRKNNVQVTVNDSYELRALVQKYRQAQQVKKAHRAQTKSPNYTKSTVAHIVKCV